MPYLPVLDAEQTQFPLAYGQDLATAIATIEEKYVRFYPATPYYQMLVKATPTSIDPVTKDRVPIGADGTTTFDPVWGERLPPGATAWKQPHGTGGAVPATETQVFDVPVLVHSERRKVSKETQLKPYGFNKVRELLIVVPLSLFDKAGVTCNQGDKIIWHQQPYMVKDFNKIGYWKNTDIALYMALNCDQYVRGA